MRYIAVIQIDRFYTRVHRAEDSGPLVVCREKSVLDANALAIARGVSLDMGMAEAKAILGGEGRILPWDEETYREEARAWLDVCTEFADAIEPTDQHQAFLDLSDHPDPRSITTRLAARLGASARIGLANCRWIASVVLSLGDPDGNALREPKRFISKLPVSALPVAPEHRQRFQFLGYRTIGEAAGVGLETLRRQFGDDAIRIAQACHGSGPADVQAAYPPDSASGRFGFEGPPETTEVFQNGLVKLSKNLGRKLIERDAYGEVLEVWLEHEDGTVDHLTRKFSKPIGSPGSLLASLGLLLHSFIEPEEAASPRPKVIGVRARVPALRKTKRVQTALNGVASKADRAVGSKAAVEHVRAAFGDGAIKLGSEIVEPRWQQVRKVWRSANGWVWG